MRPTDLMKVFVLVLLVLLLAASAMAQQQQQPQPQVGALRGRVLDQSGAVIPGAPVALTIPGGNERTTNTGADGSFAFDALPPGNYTIRAAAPNFAPFRKGGIAVLAGRRTTLDITLKVTLQKQQVDVSAETGVSLDPEASAGAVVIKGEDLEALPDDPDDLADILQAMAGPSAGPNGGQFFIDGFTGDRLPPKEAIREIRINSNPFSAEFDRMGFGRIEIFTRPGMDKFHGSLYFNYDDQHFNSRNPYSANKPDYMQRSFMGSLNGPLVKNRSSFFVSFHRREIDDNALINAQMLDANFSPVRISQSVVTPSRSMEIQPRVDFKINDKHTVVLSYGHDASSRKNAGVGDTGLSTGCSPTAPTVCVTRGYLSDRGEETLRLTETGMLSPKTVNETRFQFLKPSSDSRGDNTIPTINVQGAFTGGGSQIGHAYNDSHRFELHNITTRANGKHTLKWGGRFRHHGVDDVASSNFGGTYSFAGGFGPALDSNNRPIPGTQITLTSLDRYRYTLLFMAQGMSPAQIRANGGGASQFSLMAGIPEATVSQVELGTFFQDDWKVRPTLTLSAGLRYETQTNISNHKDWAPRLAFAWAPGGGNSPKTVFRGGFGMFYDRFSDSLVLQSRRYDGAHQQQFIVSERTDPAVLNLFPVVPSPTVLAGYAVTQTRRTIATGDRAPYTVSGALSVERQLPKSFTISVSYVRSHGLHVLRARNINAPLPGTITASNPAGVLPFGNIGNIYEYETSGLMNQNQLIFNVQNRMSRYFTVFSFYTYGHVYSNGDGGASFPANQYDLTGEYGRSSFDVRHRVFVGGSINLPGGVSMSPFVSISTGRPFNITTGQDTNGDSVYTERPAFATDLSRLSVKTTPWGAFDAIPLPGAVIIPRNYGQATGFVSANLRLTKSFGLGLRPEVKAARAQGAKSQTSNQQADSSPGGPPPGVLMGGGPGGGGPGGGPSGGSRGSSGYHGGGPRGGSPGGFSSRGGSSRGGSSRGGSGSSDYRYNVSFSISANNVLNHVNPSAPVGSMSSPFFGQSLASISGFGGFGGGGDRGGAAGNRRVEMMLRFSF